MNKLKPCPFCGKEVFLVDVSIQPAPYARWDVCCINHDCFLRGGANNLYITREDAILAWNNRAESSDLANLCEQVKVLREALEACIDLLSNLENIGGFVGLAVINNGQTALEQTKPKDGE